MAKAKQPEHLRPELADVATFFGMDLGTVRNWRVEMGRATGYKFGGKGKWNLLEIGKWLVREHYRSGAAPGGDVGESIKKARLAKLVEEAMLAGIRRTRLD